MCKWLSWDLTLDICASSTGIKSLLCTRLQAKCNKQKNKMKQ